MSLAVFLAAAALTAQPTAAQYEVEPPDILRIEVTGLSPDSQPVHGLFAVRPDGSLYLGAYGEVQVAALSVRGIADMLTTRLQPFADVGRTIAATVRVHAYNSRTVYVEYRTADGNTVRPRAFTGTETVFDAMRSMTNPAELHADTRVLLHRPRINGVGGTKYVIDWLSVVKDGESRNNFRLEPGDRVVIDETPAFFSFPRSLQLFRSQRRLKP